MCGVEESEASTVLDILEEAAGLKFLRKLAFVDANNQERLEHFNAHPLLKNAEGSASLKIEGICQSSCSGMVRIFTGENVYLWLVYLLEQTQDHSSQKIKYVGAAISCSDYGSDEEMQAFTVEGEDQSRLPTETKSHIGFQTSFGTNIGLEFKESLFDGLVHNIHAQVKLNGQEMGYYFQY